MKKYNVIIVGCGPAGAAAAKILKNNNINYCIIEKNKFPREKLCGGALSNKTQLLLNELNFNIETINKKEITEVDFVTKKINYNMNLINSITMIDRLEFDYNNLKQIKDKNIYYSENIIKIEDNMLTTNKDLYKFKYIIFADGVNGYSRKLIKNREFGFCVEYNSNININKTILDFEAIKSGYGWIFQKSNHTTIGLGKFNDKKVDYVELLLSFAKKYNLNIEKDKIKGHFIPVFSKNVFKKSVIDNKYILVGDSASLVDQVSGEGIYYAIASGKFAAESIIQCLNDNRDLKKIYYRKTKKLYKDLKKRKILSKLLYSKYGPVFIKIGLSNKIFIKVLNKMFG